VWAHSEYIKLRRSLRDGRVFDQPPQTVQRYLVEKRRCDFFLWLFNNKARTLPCGKKLRIALLSPALVHWSTDDWKTSFDTHTRDTKLGVHIVDIPTHQLPVAHPLVFTFHWDAEDRWEGVDYTVVVE
jgi:glucoamylase